MPKLFRRVAASATDPEALRRVHSQESLSFGVPPQATLDADNLAAAQRRAASDPATGSMSIEELLAAADATEATEDSRTVRLTRSKSDSELRSRESFTEIAGQATHDADAMQGVASVVSLPIRRICH